MATKKQKDLLPIYGLTEKQLHGLSKVAGDWRRRQTMDVQVCNVTQMWQYDQDDGTEELSLNHIAPWGAKDRVTENLSGSWCKSSFNGLPLDVKNKFHLSQETYDKKRMKLNVTHGPNLGYQSHSVILCTQCSSEASISKIYKKTSEMLSQ